MAFAFTAEVEIPDGGAEGMIVTEGGRFGGYGLFLSEGELGFDRDRVVFLYNLLDLKRTMWEGPELEVGKHTIVFVFKPDVPGLGRGGTGALWVDGKEVARNTMEHTIPITFPEDETFDVGEDTRTGLALVDYRYDVPFKFTGKINKLTFKLEPEAGSETLAGFGSEVIMKKLALFGAVALVAVFLPCAASAWSLREDAGYLLGEEEYVYGFPLIMMDVTREVTTAAAKSGEYAVPINQFARIRTYVSPDFKSVVRVSVNSL